MYDGRDKTTNPKISSTEHIDRINVAV